MPTPKRPLWQRLTLVAVAVGLAWAGYVWPQSGARLLLTTFAVTMVIANARRRGEWWF